MISHEQRLLRPTETLLARAAREVAPNANTTDARLMVLEAVAGLVGGWELHQYWQATLPSVPCAQTDPGPWADKILASLAETVIPPPFALAALSREILPVGEQRKAGAYYTDWRLAELLAGASVPQVGTDGLWVDPACGSGILLTAAAITVEAGAERDSVVRNRLCGADLSPRALRGALLSVASLTGSLDSITGFQSRLLLQDSLRSRETWQRLAPAGVALVIGNPPWEKLKISRHEVAGHSGVERHYGQSYANDVDVNVPRAQMLRYLDDVVTGTRLQGTGEHDLYKLFLELGLGLAAEGGILAMLVPAGLIRAQGTQTLRRELDALSRDLQIAVIENRQQHFAIDTRFKFLAVVSRVGAGRKQPWSLKVADRTGTLPTAAVRISRADLRRVRPDLSVPEVRTAGEWALYARLSQDGVLVGDGEGPWAPTYRREVDMTNDQEHFRRQASPGTLPIIEGRHVAQFRNRAKAYRSGEGRAAMWDPEPMAGAELTPQWYIHPDKIRKAALERTAQSRIGFCDITGQTNERSFLAARIPAGVVCGNKVPTLTFTDNDPSAEDLFLALANSLVVDWVMRRLVTTTVNFFLLDGLSLPRIDLDSEPGQELVALTRNVTAAEGAAKVDPWQIGQWRAKIDALVAHAWKIEPAEMRLVLADFPLLDRGQTPLQGEQRSTITADSVLESLGTLCGERSSDVTVRVAEAKGRGALPYVPAEYAGRNAL